MDALHYWDNDHTEFSLVRGTCGCCGSTYYTDPECYGEPITVEMLDKWERWLWEQIANLYKCRHIVESPMLMTTYRPGLDLAWEVAVMKAKRLGKAWRGRELPDYAHDNEMMGGLAAILDEFEDALDGDERDEAIFLMDENFSDLSDIFFEFYTKED